MERGKKTVFSLANHDLTSVFVPFAPDIFFAEKNKRALMLRDFCALLLMNVKMTDTNQMQRNNKFQS